MYLELRGNKLLTGRLPKQRGGRRLAWIPTLSDLKRVIFKQKQPPTLVSQGAVGESLWALSPSLSVLGSPIWLKCLFPITSTCSVLTKLSNNFLQDQNQCLWSGPLWNMGPGRRPSLPRGVKQAAVQWQWGPLEPLGYPLPPGQSLSKFTTAIFASFPVSAFSQALLRGPTLDRWLGHLFYQDFRLPDLNSLDLSALCLKYPFSLYIWGKEHTSCSACHSPTEWTGSCSLAVVDYNLTQSQDNPLARTGQSGSPFEKLNKHNDCNSCLYTNLDHKLPWS